MENDNNIKNDFRPVKDANLPIGLIITKNGLFKQPTKNDSEQLKLQKKSDYENLLKQNAAQQAQAKQQQVQAQVQAKQQQPAPPQQAPAQANQIPAQAKQAPAPAQAKQQAPTPTPNLEIDAVRRNLEQAISVSDQSREKQKQLEEAERIANEKLERERKENEAQLKEAQEKEAQANVMKQKATLDAEKQAAERAAQEAKAAKELAEAKARQQEAQALKAQQEAQVLLARQEARVKKAQEDASAAIESAAKVATAVEKEAEAAVIKAAENEAKAKTVPNKKAAKAEKELAKKQKQEAEKLEKDAAAAAKKERERFEKNKIIQFFNKGNKNDLKYGIMTEDKKTNVVVRTLVNDKETPVTINKSWIISVHKPDKDPKYKAYEPSLYEDKYTELTGKFLFYINGNNDIKYNLKTPNSIDINYTYKITFNNNPPEIIRIGNINYEPTQFKDTVEYKKVMELIKNEDIKEDEVEGIINKIKELINKYKTQNNELYDNFRKTKGLLPAQAQAGGKKIKRTRKMKKRKTLKKRNQRKNKQTLKQKRRGNNKRPRYTTKRCRRR
jgi:hypothetical protein